MRQITKDFRTQAMKLYVQSLAREHELLSNEIKRIIEGFPKKEKKKKRDDDSNAEASSEASFDAEAGFDTEAGFAAFKQYHQLPSRVRAKQSRTCCRPDSHSITGRGFLAPAIMNQANIKLTEQEHQLLKLGPRFIFDDPKTASRRRTTELATLKRKIETRFFEKKVRPGRPVEQFIAELDILLQNLHNIPATKKRIPSNKTQTNKSFDTLSSIIQSSQSSQSQTIIRPRKKKNYGRIVKRLKYKIHLANTILRKTDKSKVFHLEWSTVNMCQDTLFCTIDVTDLYTMVPQVEGVLSLRKMLDQLKLKQVGKLKVETIIRLSRFVMTNNYFSYNGQFYHQVRGGAMGSPLTLTISNCYMYFFERQIVNQIRNSGGLYFRYIDDIFITINWPVRHLLKEVDRWNKFDENINLSANIGSIANFLDLSIENRDGQLFTTVYQKPSYEPYYLPFNSIHPLHMKKNIPFAMLLRAIRYCSTFQSYLNEREKLRMALLLNKYPNKIIDEQFNNVLSKFGIDEPLTLTNYNRSRQKIIDSSIKEKQLVNYEKSIFVHFTYCSSMKTFPIKFHALWDKYFDKSPINEVIPILGTRNVDNLQRRLIHTKSKI
ncbi:unnamed protein product [Rotaria magnacalcarata]|uniref:Helix-turn-helix domain-containing protein n=2 Tax=Rotaria magnacalcarata TaxID=392030 RepID=A0A816Z4F7_9BILA|nr:unnamed protein product [Rotaria magnacalcarata]